MRDGSTYRQARRNAARKRGLDWRTLPQAVLRFKHSKSDAKTRSGKARMNVIVKALPMVAPDQAPTQGKTL